MAPAKDSMSTANNAAKRTWPILIGCAGIAVSAFPWAALFVVYVFGVGWDLTFVSLFMLGFILAGLILSLVAAAKSSRFWLILTAIDAILLAFVLTIISDVHLNPPPRPILLAGLIRAAQVGICAPIAWRNCAAKLAIRLVAGRVFSMSYGKF